MSRVVFANRADFGSRTVFIISRTDAIGDVVLTLPMAGVLRSLYPLSRILFLGRSYTKAVIAACENIDGFLNWDEWREMPAREAARAMAATGADSIIHVFPDKAIARVAQMARIAERIGTTNRIYHWLYCNKLVRLSRRNSNLHEAQLNLRLLVPLGARPDYSLEEIGHDYGLTRLAQLPPEVEGLLDPQRFNLILHPKSRGSAREWGLENFTRLIGRLPRQRFKIFVSGTAAEGDLLKPLLAAHPEVINLTGRLTLGQLMTFISKADGLVAASTGPLHLAAALGIHALGIYPPIRPMHPGRWAPVGPNARVFVSAEYCEDCRRSENCRCICEIKPEAIESYLLTLAT
jgi:ADP-heptose:LPS heptosyltransferase